MSEEHNAPKMSEQEIQSRIKENRRFLQFHPEEYDGYESDQDQKLTQPPLCKAGGEGPRIPLATTFDEVLQERDYETLLGQRRSLRKFEEVPVTMDQLAFLLWSTQGVQSTRGRNYCTMRPVASGGARHPFETYLAVRDVEGLQQGVYHYLPMENALEFLHPIENFEATITETLCGQAWAATAPVVFFYSVDYYRAEWRYSLAAHRVVLMDIGHVGQNLYLSSEAVGCGCCGVAAFNQDLSDALLGIDGENEATIYTVPVGVRK